MSPASRRCCPSPALPWGSGLLSFAADRASSCRPAFAIAMLGAIESLLSAVIADGMTGTKHDPNAELVALGIGNIVAPFFGGIAATGALARTATNIRAGARSPIAAVTHAVVVLLVDPRCSRRSSPTCRWRRSRRCSCSSPGTCRRSAHFVAHRARSRRRATSFVLLTCFVLTVFFDMVVAVSVGVVLAAILFMRRMAELTECAHRCSTRREDAPSRRPPEGVLVYEIAGPLFFGAAQNAMAALGAIAATRSRCSSSTSARCRSSTRPASSRSRTRSRTRRAPEEARGARRAAAEAAQDLRQGAARRPASRGRLRGEPERSDPNRRSPRAGGAVTESPAERARDVLRSSSTQGETLLGGRCLRVADHAHEALHAPGLPVRAPRRDRAAREEPCVRPHLLRSRETASGARHRQCPSEVADVVHGDHAVYESLVVLEYLDDCTRSAHSFPKDSLARRGCACSRRASPMS